MKTAAIYCRVSTDNQEREGTSLQTQLEGCLNYCHGKGYDVSYRFSEAYSGLSLERPELDKLRELLRNEAIDVLVCYSLDRLTRDPGHGVIITQELEKHRITLEAVTEDVDNSELGKLISYIRGFASKLETEKIKERTMRGKKASAISGKIPHGGFARLYGYDYDRTEKKCTINTTEAYWVKQAYEWLVNEGLSTNAITYRLRELSAPTKHSRYWNRSSVAGILKNPAYTGKTYAFTFNQGKNTRKPQHEWIEIPGATPAIITEETFRAAQVQLKLNYEKARRNMKGQYLLKGHLYCRQCGHIYCGHIDRQIGYYRCPGKLRITSPVNRCTNKNWRADKLETLIWDKIQAVLDNPELITQEIEKHRQDVNQLSALETELQQIERQLKSLKHDQEQLLQWALKGFPEDQIIEENRKINDKRESLQARKIEREMQIKGSQEAVISLPKLESFVELIRQKLTTLDYNTKRQAVDMLGIKVWLEGENIEITGTIPVDDSDIVTISS